MSPDLGYLFCRAAITSAYPSFASIILEMSAMAGEWPAVMKCPYHRAAPFFKESEKQRIVEIITVDVVEVDEVRIYLFNFLDEGFCGFFRGEAMSVKQTCLQSMPHHIEAISDFY